MDVVLSCKVDEELGDFESVHDTRGMTYHGRICISKAGNRCIDGIPRETYQEVQPLRR
jgi:hypothetical protein